MSDCEAILEYVYAACREEGAVGFAYHFTSAFDSPTSKRTAIWARDYPLEHQKLYVTEDWRSQDPLPRLTFKHGPIMTRNRARQFARRERPVQNFLELLEKHGIDRWACFALYGPRNRDGYASMRFSEEPDGFDDGRLESVHTLLTAAHLQICAIMAGGSASVTLSDREHEVLEWMGQGKSSSDIATILAISPETVRTYTRRIYDKLQTNDRVTATVRALKLGLVEL